MAEPRRTTGLRPERDHRTAQYRVEAVAWEGHHAGAAHLEGVLNDWAADGWEVIAVVPTTAGTSIRSLVAASAAANTTEFAIVARRNQ